MNKTLRKMNYLKIGLPALALCGGLAFSGCDKNGNLNVLSIEDDKRLGAQTDSTILATPSQFKILDSVQYANAYSYLKGIRDRILNSGEVEYRQAFNWNVRIVHEDSTLNAFATPGGYIYVYTGLIKYLDTEDQLAGVMGHELAHAALRHTSRNITQQMGYGTVLAIALGNGTAAQLGSIALQLKDLSYSRGYEQEADKASVRYLAKTEYACNGAAGFFEKLLSGSNTNEPPVFLSTHPSSSSRVADINKEADDKKCDKTPIAPPTYDSFKGMLP